MILPKINGYVKTFKVKDGDKDKKNKLMSFHIGDDKLFKKYNTIWTKVESLRNIKLKNFKKYFMVQKRNKNLGG